VSYTPLSLQTATGGMRSIRGGGSNLALLQFLQQQQEQSAPKPPFNLRGSSRRLSSGADPTLASSVAGDAAGVSTGGTSQSETSSPERGDAGSTEIPAHRRSLQRGDSRGRRIVSPTPYGNDTDEEDAAGGALLSVSRVASSRKIPHASAGTSHCLTVHLLPTALSSHQAGCALTKSCGLSVCGRASFPHNCPWVLLSLVRIDMMATTVRTHIHPASRANPAVLL
jgi:hypothetical protein